MRNAPIRILVVEDDPERIGTFEMCVEGWNFLIVRRKRPALKVVFVWAKTAGNAIGMLRRDRGRTYHGIMLDHDLTKQKQSEHEEQQNGKDVVNAIIEFTDKTVPIFVHSSNITEGPKMAKLLRKAGFTVTRQAYGHLQHQVLGRWLEEVRAVMEEEDEEIPTAN